MSVINRFAALAVGLLLVFGIPVTKAGEPHKILMVVSSHGQQNGEVQPGYEFDEFAKAYKVFEKNGLHIDVASPKGGAVEADKFEPEKPFNRPVLDDAVAMAKLASTVPTADINAEDYAAVFVVGGKGAMFDLPVDSHLQRTIAAVYEGGGVVSAVCHGPAALVNVQLSSGKYLVNGKRVNGFTNIEENALGSRWLDAFPFLLEDELLARGGLFESAPFMLSHVAEDGRLITGQNPASTTDIAVATLRALGVEAPRFTRFKEDVTLALVADLLAGNANAMDALVDAPDDYQIDLIGMYGYYYLDLVSETDQMQDAVTLMEAANKTMQHPVLGIKIVEAHGRLGEHEVAIEKAEALALAMPDNEKVQALLASLKAS